MVRDFAQIAARRTQTSAHNRQGNHQMDKGSSQIAMGNIKAMDSRMVMSRNSNIIDNSHLMHSEKMMSGKNLR